MLTACITVLAAYDAFFGPRRLWVRERFVLNSVRDLQREWRIDRAQAGPSAQIDAREYTARLNKILQDTLKEWTGSKNSE